MESVTDYQMGQTWATLKGKEDPWKGLVMLHPARGLVNVIARSATFLPNHPIIIKRGSLKSLKTRPRERPLKQVWKQSSKLARTEEVSKMWQQKIISKDSLQFLRRFSGRSGMCRICCKPVSKLLQWESGSQSVLIRRLGKVGRPLPSSSRIFIRGKPISQRLSVVWVPGRTTFSGPEKAAQILPWTKSHLPMPVTLHPVLGISPVIVLPVL